MQAHRSEMESVCLALACLARERYDSSIYIFELPAMKMYLLEAHVITIDNIIFKLVMFTQNRLMKKTKIVKI